MLIPKIQVAATPDGTLTYLVDQPPADLPPVQARDLQAAWELARDAARGRSWGDIRAFHFRRDDGGWTDLALHDADAQCWAGAVDRALGLQTCRGLSVCLRLLALVDLLARAPWAAGLMQLDRHGAELHPALLRLAAQTRLTDDARFDEAVFRACLHTLPEPPRPQVPATGAAPP